MARLGALSYGWLVGGILLTAGTVFAIVFLPIQLSGEGVGSCNNTAAPLDLTGQYNGTFSCEGVNDGGSFVAGGTNNIWTIYHDTADNTLVLTDTTTGHTYAGVVPEGTNTRGNREVAVWTGHVPYFLVGRWEVLRRCYSGGVNEFSVNLMGQSIAGGELSMEGPKAVKTCAERLTRFSIAVPPTPAPTAEPTMMITAAPTPQPTPAPTAEPTTAAPTMTMAGVPTPIPTPP